MDLLHSCKGVYFYNLIDTLIQTTTLFAEAGMINDETIVRPLEATEDDLLVAHTKKYLDSLRVCNFLCLYMSFLK